MCANWTAWRYIGELLTLLGCSTNELAFSNDGDIVPEATARLYGEAIRDAVMEHRIFEITISDDNYVEGFYQRPIIVADIENWKENLKENINAEKARDYGQVAPAKSKAILKAGMIERSGRLPKEIDDDTKKWLLEWSEFFINSGGFAQW